MDSPTLWSADPLRSLVVFPGGSVPVCRYPFDDDDDGKGMLGHSRMSLSELQNLWSMEGES